MSRDGKYSNITEFLPQAPAAPGQPGFSSSPTYANVAASNPGRARKKNKGKSVGTVAQVTASSSSVAPKIETLMIPAADQRFFIPRGSPLPHLDGLGITASTPDIVASVLREANCPIPQVFTTTVNTLGSLILMLTSLHTPATYCLCTLLSGAKEQTQ